MTSIGFGRDFKDFPKNVKEAFLLKEDQYFYYHPGFNPYLFDLGPFFKRLSLGKSHSGASTITMQLARLHYGLKTKTLNGKIKTSSFWVAWLELKYSKDEDLGSLLKPYSLWA